MPSAQGTEDPEAHSWVQGGLFCQFPDHFRKPLNLGTEKPVLYNKVQIVLRKGGGKLKMLKIILKTGTW